MLRECTLGSSRVLRFYQHKVYITIILACVVQVDAFYCESLSCYICIVMVVVCVKLEYWFGVRVWYNQGFTVEQCLLWVTCTGHHWLIAL